MYLFMSVWNLHELIYNLLHTCVMRYVNKRGAEYLVFVNIQVQFFYDINTIIAMVAVSTCASEEILGLNQALVCAVSSHIPETCMF